MAVIGISCFFHDSAAAVIDKNGEILGAVHEERFTRKKHDSRFPLCSIDYCLKLAKDRGESIDAYVYYEKPIWVFMRLLETYFTTSPRGFSSFLPAMKTWISKKLFTKKEIITSISQLDKDFKQEDLFFSEHHLSHAGAAYYPSPFDKAAILCLDAVGETVTTSAWIGEKESIKPFWEINFPHSIGMLYSAFTYYCGFKVNSGEYKLMGLAPYGSPKYRELILDNLIEVNEDGSYTLNMKYFKYHRGLRMISSSFRKLFNNVERNPDDPISQFYMDVAASIQVVIEEIVVKIARNIRKKTGLDNLCLAGGVALNCVANGKILDESGFKNIWVQPASGDAGSALGAALVYRYQEKKEKRIINSPDSMKSSLLGPEFKDSQIQTYLDDKEIPYSKFKYDELYKKVAEKLDSGKIIGWFQGRMEYGPRALGNRSILGDPRAADMQRKMNLKIKNRESFRPFAPAILDGFQKEYFGLEHESPYMLLTRNLSSKFLKKKHSNSEEGLKRVNEIRSSLPAVTHIDYSCRVQTVSEERNPIFYRLLSEFNNITNCPVLINTSFNVRGEPVVCTPEDAFNCFINTEIDLLVMGPFLIDKLDIKSGFELLFPKPFTIKD